MFSKEEKGLIILISFLVICGLWIFTYYPAKMRLERIYKIENPTFGDVMLQIFTE